jgi:hypothetical protein
MPDHMKDA